MANFGETLTYWYLRLNGFFPLTNFVLHKSGEHKHSADADLLAVRFKHVYEPIGGQTEDWDLWFESNGLALTDRVTGLIIEVKTGRVNSQMIVGSFSEARLRYAVERFGFFRDSSMVEASVTELGSHPVMTTERYRIGKLLVTSDSVSNLDRYPPCLHLKLQEIEDFIAIRMEKYTDRKSGDRMLFPDDLIQYFAWKSGGRFA
jgi:hypothetical protein